MFKKYDLPNNWEIISLKNVLKLSSGKTRPKNLKDSPEGEFSHPVYGGNGIIGYSKKHLIDSKTIAIGRVGAYCGSIYATNNKSWITDNALYVKEFINENVDFNFLTHVLRILNLNKLKKKGGQPLISQSIVYSQYIPLPSIETQKKIVEILEKVEKLKEWRAEADELTDDYLKNVFLEMFGSPVKNEKGWKIADLKEIASIDKKSIKAELIDENSNYIGLEHLESGTGKIPDISSAKKAGLKSNKYLFDDKCVLYGKLRPYLNKVALPNFEGVCSTDILPIRPKKDKSNRYFIKYLLSLDYYIKKSTEQSTGANLPRISPKALENFKVYAPPITLQNQFAEIVQQVETLKSYQTQSKKEIDNLFNTLMQKAFKGELLC